MGFLACVSNEVLAAGLDGEGEVECLRTVFVEDADGGGVGRELVAAGSGVPSSIVMGACAVPEDDAFFAPFSAFSAASLASRSALLCIRASFAETNFELMVLAKKWLFDGFGLRGVGSFLDVPEPVSSLIFLHPSTNLLLSAAAPYFFNSFLVFACFLMASWVYFFSGSFLLPCSESSSQS